MAILRHGIDRAAGVAARARTAFDTKRQSASVAERCLAFLRFAPQNFIARLPGPRGSPSSVRSYVRSRRLFLRVECDADRQKNFVARLVEQPALRVVPSHHRRAPPRRTIDDTGAA